MSQAEGKRFCIPPENLADAKAAIAKLSSEERETLPKLAGPAIILVHNGNGANDVVDFLRCYHPDDIEALEGLEAIS